MIRRLWSDAGQHLREILRFAASAFLVKAFAALITLVFNIVIARKLGASGVGIFFLAIAVVTVLSVVCRLGTYNAVVRLVASFSVAKEWGRLKAVYWEAIGLTLLSSVIGAALLWWLAKPMADQLFGKPELATPLSWAAIVLVPLTLSMLHAAFFQGAKRVVLSLLLQNVLTVSIVTLALLFYKSTLTVTGSVVLYAIASFISLAVAVLYFVIAFARVNTAVAQKSPGLLMNSAAPMFSISLVSQILLPWAPILLLGIWADSSEVGLYGVANRVALLIGFVLIAVNSIAAPKFAELHRQKNHDDLATTVQHATRLMSLAATPALILMVFFPQQILGIFGEEFRNGWPILVILAVGQFVNVVSGSVGFLLMMTGNARLYRNGALLAAIVGVTLALVLIPWIGAIGAAISAVTAQSTVNLLGVYFAKTRLDILTIPWPRFDKSAAT